MSLHVFLRNDDWFPILWSSLEKDKNHTAQHAWLIDTASPRSSKKPGRYLLIACFVRADLVFNQPAPLLTPKSIPTKRFESGCRFKDERVDQYEPLGVFFLPS